MKRLPRSVWAVTGADAVSAMARVKPAASRGRGQRIVGLLPWVVSVERSSVAGVGQRVRRNGWEGGVRLRGRTAVGPPRRTIHPPELIYGRAYAACFGDVGGDFGTGGGVRAKWDQMRGRQPRDQT